ncbi:unnamed protein product, partial [marine sediment metagenome]
NPDSTSMNLSGWTLSDDGTDVETLAGFNGSSTILEAHGYAVITDEDSVVVIPNTSIHLTTQDNSMCSYGLSNSGETIILRDDENKIVDVVTYDDWVDENHSLERVDINGYSSDPDNWAESIEGGTPGQENSVSVSGGCDWTLQIILNGSVFEDPEFQIKVVKLKGEERANLTVEKWIEDSTGNIDKTYSPRYIKNILNYQTSSKYSPSLAKGDAYFIKANITNVSCEDANLSNNLISAMIFVVDEEQSINPNSSINISE